MKRALLAILAALTLVGAGTATAQQAWPTRNVKLVVAAAPGGNPDILGRMLAQRLTEMLGQPFVVENQPGAGGVVAAIAVTRAKPDGYTFILGDSGAMAINVALQPDLAYKPLKDFTLVTALATVPTVLVAHPSVAAKTLPELIDFAKKEKQGFRYGSAGLGSIHHLTMAIFADRAGLDVSHIPYKGGSAMVAGLLTGDIHVGWSGVPNIKPLIASGKLKAYCISILERSQSVPDVPTCDEVGQKGFDVASMIGLQGPAGLPANVVEIMQASVAKILREPALIQRMTELGMVMQEKGTAHYQKFVVDDLNRYTDIVKRLKIEVKQ